MSEDQADEPESTLGPDIEEEYKKAEPGSTARAMLLGAKAIHELGNAVIHVSNAVLHIADATDKFGDNLTDAIEDAGRAISDALEEPLKSVTSKAASYLTELLKKSTNGEKPPVDPS